MEGAGLLETAAQSSCVLAALGFMLVATASRSERLESMVQWSVVAFSLLAALFLVLLWWEGGSIWGSEAMTRPLAVLCVMIALAARLNLKGKQLSQGKNPHQIMREANDSE